MSRSRPRIAAIVPMRHSSERVPEKNFRPFAGKPLYQWIVGSLLKCEAVDEVLIDTDSPAIRKTCRRDFPQVTLLERPAHLRAGEVPMNEVLLNTVGQVEADYYVQTHSTNPLLESRTIQTAIEAFLGQVPSVDSLFTVTRLQTRIWDGLSRPVNHDPALLLRTQDLPPLFEENSCLYVFSEEVLRQEMNRIGRKPLMWEINAQEAWDIDEEIDFRVAELLFLQGDQE